jgi:ribosomal protein S12 methylthiotransferase accessory factor
MATPPLDAALTLSPANFPNCAPAQGSELTCVLEACAKAGVDLWFANLIREAIGVPVFRAVSTKLCHYKPRFARRRLLAPDARDLSTPIPTPELQTPLLI